MEDKIEGDRAGAAEREPGSPAPAPTAPPAAPEDPAPPRPRRRPLLLQLLLLGAAPAQPDGSKPGLR